MGIDKITGLETGVEPPKEFTTDKITGQKIPVRPLFDKGSGKRSASSRGDQSLSKGGAWFSPKELGTLSYGNKKSRDSAFEARALNQSTGEKWEHGLKKAGITFGGAFLENTLGITAGLINLAQGESFFDTPLGQTIDEWNKMAQEKYPNYMTKKEQDTISIFSANFWADKVLNGAAYSLASVASLLIPGGPIANVSRAAKIGRNAFRTKQLKNIVNEMSRAKEVEGGINTIAKTIEEGGSTWNKIGKGITTAGLKGETLLGSALAESNVEARELQNNFMDEQIKRTIKEKRAQYLKQNPNATNEELSKIALNDNELQKIQKSSELAGALNFITNAVLVGGTQMLMFGRLLSGKQINNIMKNPLKKYVTKDIETGKWIDGRSQTRKLWHKLTENQPLEGWERLYIGVPLGSVTEGGQEIGQFISQKAYGDFFGAKLQGGNLNGSQDLISSFTNATMEAFTTKEGLEQALIGALVGGGSTAIRGVADIIQKNVPEDSMKEYLDIVNDPDFFGSNLNIRKINQEELSYVSLQAMKNFNEAVENNDPVLAAKEYNVMIQAQTLKSLTNDTFDIFRQNMVDTQNMSNKEFADFLGIDENWVTEEKKVQMVKEITDQLDNNKKIFDKVEDLFAQNPVDPTITGRIIKTISPKFYKENQIYEARSNFAKEVLFRHLSTKDWINQEYDKISQEIKEIKASLGIGFDENIDQGRNFVEGKVLRDRDLNVEDPELTDEQKITRRLVRLNKIFEKGPVIDNLIKSIKGTPAYQDLLSMINILNNTKKTKLEKEDILNALKNKSQLKKDKLKFTPKNFKKDVLSLFEQLEQLRQISDSGTELQLANATNKMVRLAITEAEAEFEYSILKKSPVQESLMSEYIKKREENIQEQIDSILGPMDIDQIRQTYKKTDDEKEGKDNPLVKDYEEPRKETSEWYQNAISYYEEQLKMVEDLKDGSLKEKYIEHINKKIKTLKKEYSDYLKNKRKDSVKDGAKISDLQAYQFLMPYLYNEETRSNMEIAFSATKGLSDKDILKRMSIRIEEIPEETRGSTREKEIEGNTVSFHPGIPQDVTKGMYLYFDDLVIGKLTHPDSIKINGQNYDLSNSYHLHLLNPNFTEKDSEGKIVGTSVEGYKFISSYNTLKNLLLPIKEGKTDKISGNELSENFDVVPRLFYNKLNEVPFEERPGLTEFFKNKFDVFKYKFLEEMEEGILAIVEKGKDLIPYFFDGENWNVITDTSLISKIRAKTNKIHTPFKRSSHVILNMGEHYIKTIVDYPPLSSQEKETAFKDFYNKLLGFADMLEDLGPKDFVKAVADMSPKERNLLLAKDGTIRKFITTKRGEEFTSGDVYVSLIMEQHPYKEGELPKFKILVKNGDNMQSVNLLLSYNEESKMFIGRYEDKSLNIALTDLDSLVEYINNRIEEGVKHKGKEETLSGIKINGLKHDIIGNIEKGKMGVTPRATIFLRPNYKNKTKEEKQFYKDRKEQRDSLKKQEAVKKHIKNTVSEILSLIDSFNLEDAKNIIPRFVKISKDDLLSIYTREFLQNKIGFLLNFMKDYKLDEETSLVDSELYKDLEKYFFDNLTEKDKKPIEKPKKDIDLNSLDTILQLLDEKGISSENIEGLTEEQIMSLDTTQDTLDILDQINKLQNGETTATELPFGDMNVEEVFNLIQEVAPTSEDFNSLEFAIKFHKAKDDAMKDNNFERLIELYKKYCE